MNQVPRCILLCLPLRRQRKHRRRPLPQALLPRTSRPATITRRSLAAKAAWEYHCGKPDIISGSLLPVVLQSYVRVPSICNCECGRQTLLMCLAPRHEWLAARAGDITVLSRQILTCETHELMMGSMLKLPTNLQTGICSYFDSCCVYKIVHHIHLFAGNKVVRLVIPARYDRYSNGVVGNLAVWMDFRRSSGWNAGNIC